MPLFHVHGLIGVTLASLAAGGTVVMPARVRMRTFWEAVAEHDAVVVVDEIPHTATGKILTSQSGRRHLAGSKNRKRKRHLAKMKQVDKTDRYRILANLPFA